jgi:hypothetical protein
MPGVDAVCISAGEFVRGLKAKPVKDISSAAATSADPLSPPA